MRAAVRDRYGPPPEVVRVVEVDRPAVRDRDVLVRVHATTVNRTDCGLRAPWIYRLLLGLRRPRRTVLGTEFAGEVEAVGDGVTACKVGDRVFGFSGTTFGAYAEDLALPEDGSMMAAIPEGLTFEEAAPAARARTTPARRSGRPRSGAARTCSSTAPPALSARRRSSS
jgi:NADPH:quinone reductase-like Zn-dependent oxidoreductase